MITSPLLETKFHVPTGHGRLVPRPRLTDQIARAQSAPLTLVSAPAGFGKTTVMTELAGRPDGAVVAWLSLDASDNDPLTFWTYVTEALDRAVPGFGTGARSVLSGGQGGVDVAVTSLLNALAGLATDLVLVLDDVHVIESPAIHGQLGYFLEHLPGPAHVVMGTRADPAIPLARLRARGGLVEIRATDLRFTGAEAARYLAEMGLSLGEGDISTLEARTEGWIAALQLAALSLQGRGDPSEFIEAFAGDDRYIVDYLVEEVLRRQPADVRDFLLKTSILARFTGSLVDSVTARGGGAAMIEALDRGNLFLVALDSQRRWYRYHHLFAGVLQAYLAAEQPDEVALLHRRASLWYDRNGDPGEAIEHALRAGDADRAAELVELASPEMRRSRREPALRRWLDSIPREVVERRPVLAVEYAGTILSANETDGVPELLATGERLLSTGVDGTGAGAVVVDAGELERLPAAIELLRSGLRRMQGDLVGTVEHARHVLDLVGAADHVTRGGAAALLGLAYWARGDLEAGYRWYAEGMASLEKSGHIADLVAGAITRADIRLTQGRLGEAMRIYEEGLELAMRVHPPLRGAPDMHTGLADIAYQRDQLGAAKDHLEAGRRLGDELAFLRDPYRSRVVEARIRQAEGEVDAALTLLNEAERLYVSEFAPNVRPVAAIRARVLIAHGRLAEARQWARGAGVSGADDVSYVREYEHTTLARLLLAEAAEGDAGGRGDAGGLAEAMALLDRLLAAAEQGGRDGSRFEILVTQALAKHAAGDADGAFRALDVAVSLAQPDGYVRGILDEGPAMTRLLKLATRRPDAPAYLQALVRTGAGQVPSQQGLIEPLSERELEVLRLLRSDLDGPELARELVVSLNTLRTHTKNVYSKLGVGSRRAAVRRGEELGLI